MVESKLVNVADAVREHAQEIRTIAISTLARHTANELVQRILNSLGKIELVAEIEATIVLECLHHVNEFLVLLRRGDRHDRVRERNVHELFDKHDLGACLKHLTDDVTDTCKSRISR